MVADEEHAGIAVKNLLRSVAVMHVPIEDADTLQTIGVTGVGGGNGDIVEKAKAHRLLGARVVPRWPCAAEGAVKSVPHHGIDRPHSRPGG